MDSKDKKIVAWSLIAFGISMALFNSLGIPFSNFIFPLFLVVGGWWLIVKSPTISSFNNPQIYFVKEFDFDDRWDPKNKNIFAITGEINLDMRGIQLPEGDTIIQYNCIAGELDIRIEKNSPLKILTQAIVVNSNMDGIKKEDIFSGKQFQSENFELSKNRLILIANAIAIELDVTIY